MQQESKDASAKMPVQRCNERAKANKAAADAGTFHLLPSDYLISKTLCSDFRWHDLLSNNIPCNSYYWLTRGDQRAAEKALIQSEHEDLQRSGTYA